MPVMASRAGAIGVTRAPRSAARASIWAGRYSMWASWSAATRRAVLAGRAARAMARARRGAGRDRARAGQGAGGGGQAGVEVEVVQVPAQPVGHLGAVFDQRVAVIGQQPQRPGVLIEAGEGQVQVLPQREPGDRQRVDRVGLAALAAAASRASPTAV
jgi:hypothetical protein